MTHVQNDYFQMMAATRRTCESHHAAWAGNAIFSAEYNAFITDVMDKLPAAISKQIERNNGITITKLETRESLQQQLIRLIEAIRVYALTTRQPFLIEKTKMPEYKVMREKDYSLVGLAENFLLLAKAYLNSLAPFGVTQQTLDDLKTTSDSFSDMIGQPFGKIRERKRATEDLAALFEKGRSLLKTIDDLMVIFKASEPVFYAAYFHARKIIKHGARTRALMVTVTNTEGLPIPGVTFVLPSPKLKRKTSEKGNCRADYLQPGEYFASFMHPEYEYRRVQFFINQGETTTLEVTLSKAQAN